MAKLKFMIANVTCAARQLTILKYFAELTQVVNTVKWHWRQGVFNHRQLDCLSNRLFRLTAKQTQKLHITEFCGNVRPSHPHHHSAADDIEQVLLILVTAIVNILGSCSALKFYTFYTHWPVWGMILLPLYSPQYSRDCIDILHSHYPEWQH